MKTVTKKLSVLLFMSAGMLPLLFILFFGLRQEIIRNRMHKKMEEQQLQTLILPDGSVQWAEKGKEVWIDGRLFDVQSIEYGEGTTILHGLFDEEETSLKETFRNEWQKNMSDQSQLLAKIFQCINGFYCNNLPDLNSWCDNSDMIFPITISQLSFWVNPIITPPPRA